MTKFVPIDPEGMTDRQLMEALVHGQNLTHACVHRIERDSVERDRKAEERRDALAGTVNGLRGSLQALGRQIGAIKFKQDTDSARITLVSKALRVEKRDKGEKIKASWRTQPKWKIATTILGSVSGLVLVIQIAAPALIAGAKAFWVALMAAH